jgi:annexin-like protein
MTGAPAPTDATTPGVPLSPELEAWLAAAREGAVYPGGPRAPEEGAEDSPAAMPGAAPSEAPEVEPVPEPAPVEEPVAPATPVKVPLAPPVSSSPLVPENPEAAETVNASNDSELQAVAERETAGVATGPAPVPTPEPVPVASRAPMREAAPLEAAGAGATIAEIAEEQPAGPRETPESSEDVEGVLAAPEVPAEEAAPVPDAVGEVSELEAWRESVLRSTVAVPHPDLAGASSRAGAAVQEPGSAAATRHREAGREIPGRGREAVSDAPEVAEELPPLEPDPIPVETARVEAASDRRLPDQTPPALVASPQGNMPRLGQMPLSEEQFRALISPSLFYGPLTEEQAAEQAKLEQARENLMNPPEVAAEAAGQPAPIVDVGVEPPPPLPPLTRTDLAGVLARLLQDRRGEALKLMQNARMSAYKGMLEMRFSGLGDDVLLPDVEASLTTQLQGVAEQAGVTAEEMTQAIEQRRADLEQQCVAAADDLALQTEATREEVRQAGQERLDAVATTEATLEAEVEQREQAASSQADPAAIYARRDRLVAKVNEKAGGQVAAYRQAGERREAELSNAEREQAAAYQAVAQRDELQILSRYTDPNDPQAQDLAAASRAWSMDRITAVQADFQKLRTETRTTVDLYQREVREAGGAAREALNAWAEETTGERRSFWERLFDEIRGWGEQARAEAQAWAAVENRRTAEAIAGDLTFVNQVSRAAANGLTEEELRQAGRLNAAQDAMVTEFFRGEEAGNTIAAVAAGLRVRLAAEHLPSLLQKFEKLLIDKPKEEWEALRDVARAVNPGFNPEKLTSDLHRAVDQWGTDEGLIYRSLANLTPLEVAILRKVYSVRGWGDLDAELRDELSGAELQRAQRLMASEPRAADAAALREAIEGAGTDEATIMSVLRNKTPEERKQIIDAYKAMYGDDLQADLKDDLGGNDLLRADLLMQGNTAAADAIAVHDSLHGFWGADVDDVSNVYSQIRQDVSALAAREGWTTAQMEAEIRRRNQQVESEFNGRFAGEYRTPSGQSALRHQFQVTIFNPAERDLAKALADNDLARADAARIRIEERGLWASDEKINKVLNSQYTRALEDVRRDVGPELRRRMVTDVLKREMEAAEKAGTPWNAADQWERQQALERAYERELESRARVQAEGNMGALDAVYQGEYNRNLGTVIERNMSGNDLQEARDRVAQGGYLTPAQQVYYAVDGPGTKEEELKAALRGRTEAEIQDMREEYERTHPGRSFDKDILGDVSGRDYFDMQIALKGEPEKLQAMLDREREKVQYEADTGLLGSMGAAGAEKAWLRSRMEALERDAARMHDRSLPAAERARLVDQFNYQVEVVDDAIEEHRRALDSFAETAAMVAAIVAGALVTALTLGSAGLVVAGILGALAATAASMSTKALILGRAYGVEAIGVDLAVGAVDVLFAGLTAGMGGRLLGLVGRQGVQSLKQAGPIMSRLLKFPPLGRLAGREAGALARMVRPSPVLQRATQAGRSKVGAFMAREAAEVAESVAGSLPSAALGNTINDANWEHGNPLANILLGTVQQVGQGAAVGRGVAHVSNIAGKAVSRWRGGGAAPETPAGRGDILAERGTPAQRLEQWQRFKAENPGANFADFSRQLDEGVLARRAEGEAARQQEGSLRRQVLQDVPPRERGVLGDVPVRTVSDAEFAARGGRPGDATVLGSEGGAAVLMVRDGATAAELAAQGTRLARAVVRDAVGRPVDANRVLPPDLQGRIPVRVDPTLASNTVRVVYDVHPRTGLVSGIRIVVGPRATSVDINLHAGTVRLMERYAGFLGRARLLIERIQGWITKNGPPPPGTRAWEARLEVEKLPRIILDRLEQLRAGGLDARTRKALLDDIADLRRQLDGHEQALRDMELEPGRGFVAAEGRPPAEGGTPVREGAEEVAPPRPGEPVVPAEAAVAPVAVKPEPATVRDVPLDPFWREARKSIAGFEPMMRQLETRPDLLSPAEFDAVLRSVPANEAAARTFVNQLNAVLKRLDVNTRSGRPLPGVESVIKGLASPDPGVQSTARFLMESSAKVTNPIDSGLYFTDTILSKFSLADVQAVRDLHPGVKDTQLLTAMADVTRDVNADAVAIRELVNEAGSLQADGTPVPDIRRLNAVLEAMGPGPHSATDVRAGIRQQNELAAELAALGDDLVRDVLKHAGVVPAENATLKLSEVPLFQTGGKVSGSKVNKYFRLEERVELILREVVDSNGTINDAKWLQIEKALRESDLDPLISSGIIGYYWERVRLRSLERIRGAGRVFDQVVVDLEGEVQQPRIDALIIESIDPQANVVRVSMEEDKTGRAVLSSAQEKLFDRVNKLLDQKRQGNAELDAVDPGINVVLPPEVLSQLSDPSKVKVIIVGIAEVRARTNLPKR